MSAGSARWRAGRGASRARRNRRTGPQRPRLRGAAIRAIARAIGSAIVPTVLALGAVISGGAIGVSARLWLTTSDRFAIEAITVVGNHRLDSRAVERSLGIARGDNIFEVDVGDAERSLVANPWVVKARVVRQLPDRLRVELEEHAPAAA